MGWRIISSSVRLERQANDAVSQLCTDALKSDCAENSDIVIAGRRFGTEWIIVKGLRGGVDAHGRPGGWLFRCLLSSDFTENDRGLSAYILSVFTNEKDWTASEALEPLYPDYYDFQSDTGTCKIFGEKTPTSLQTLERELAAFTRPRQSFIFPVQSSNPAFSINLNRNGEIMPVKYKPSYKRYSAVWEGLAVLFLLTTVFVGYRFYDETEKHNLTKEQMGSEIQTITDKNESLILDLTKRDGRIDDLEELISEKEAEVRTLEENKRTMEEKVQRLEIKVTDLGKDADKALQRENDKLQTEVDEVRSKLEEQNEKLRLLFQNFNEYFPHLIPNDQNPSASRNMGPRR